MSTPESLRRDKEINRKLTAMSEQIRDSVGKLVKNYNCEVDVLKVSPKEGLYGGSSYISWFEVKNSKKTTYVELNYEHRGSGSEIEDEGIKIILVRNWSTQREVPRKFLEEKVLSYMTGQD